MAPLIHACRRLGIVLIRPPILETLIALSGLYDAGGDPVRQRPKCVAFGEIERYRRRPFGVAVHTEPHRPFPAPDKVLERNSRTLLAGFTLEPSGQYLAGPRPSGMSNTTPWHSNAWLRVSPTRSRPAPTRLPGTSLDLGGRRRLHGQGDGDPNRVGSAGDGGPLWRRCRDRGGNAVRSGHVSRMPHDLPRPG
jgi:hypothetical protein